MRFAPLTDINGDMLAVNLDAVHAVSDRKNMRAVQLANGNTVYVTETLDDVMAELAGSATNGTAPDAGNQPKA